MKSLPLMVLVTYGSLGVTGIAAAQTGGTRQVELGMYGSYTHFGQAATGLSSRPGAGGRLGFYLGRLVSLEAAGDYTPSRLGTGGPSVDVSRLGGTMLFHARALGMYLGGGYERLYYRGGLLGHDDGGHIVLGSRMALGGRTALRVEGRVAYLPSSGTGTDHPLNLGANLGLSIFAFGGPPRDADGDGIGDKHDVCPDTPAGAMVDRRGCPRDSDNDKVLDGIDQCGATPAGALVDGRGCPLDNDADGVPDGLDLCSETPAGAAVDPNGCPSDADRDGAYDGLDQCADTPAGATVDAHGCPADSDRDGVLDGIDQCPSTPGGVAVDARGCPAPKDSDRDGVPDPKDRCPNTPGGTRVDAAGCPVVAPGPLFRVVGGRAQPLILKGVNFASGQSSLTPGSSTVLDEVAASLLAHPSVKIEIAGHTDATGSRRLNTTLSLARALAVRTYLVSKGVSPSRLTAHGYGPDRPIADNRTAAGRAKNRRVELRLLEGSERPPE